jgi:hypothetical protein
MSESVEQQLKRDLALTKVVFLGEPKFFFLLASDRISCLPLDIGAATFVRLTLGIMAFWRWCLNGAWLNCNWSKDVLPKTLFKLAVFIDIFLNCQFFNETFRIGIF